MRSGIAEAAEANELRSDENEVAVGELIGDFLDVAELPDSDGWTLKLPDGRSCPGELTLVQIGMPRTIILFDSSPNGSQRADSEAIAAADAAGDQAAATSSPDDTRADSGAESPAAESEG